MSAGRRPAAIVVVDDWLMPPLLPLMATGPCGDRGIAFIVGRRISMGTFFNAARLDALTGEDDGDAEAAAAAAAASLAAATISGSSQLGTSALADIRAAARGLKCGGNNSEKEGTAK